MAIILETKNISKEFSGHKAVDKINLQIKQGDIYGLIGRNGAGKTTLMRMICGLAHPSSGSYKIFGREGKNDALAIKRVSCLIENTGIYPNLTAKDHLLLKSLALGISNHKEINEILKMVGLKNTARKKVKQFSLGMKQRLGIALALIGKPDLIVLDEPINGLDPQGIVEVRELIEQLNREKGITFMISSHILAELAKFSTRFGIIDNGQLIADFTREELEKQNRNRIEIGTSQVEKAVTILDELSITEYKVVRDNKVYIFEGMDRSGEIVTALVKADIPIETFNVHQASLEDSYLALTNGRK